MHDGLMSEAGFDALLVLSFGGPERAADVMPFLRNVTRGRGVPDDRLAAVAEHYYARGGVSPINSENRDLVAALRYELQARGRDVPVLWGNRNWSPFLLDALREAWLAGHRRLRVLVTSAFPSYSGCRQYREELAAALATLADEGRQLNVELTPRCGPTPGYVRDCAAALRAAHTRLAARRGPAEPAPGSVPRTLFVTHSIPVSMARRSGPDGDGYLGEQRAACVQIARLAGVEDWELVFCSRSGPPTQAWLEPDVNDRLRDLAGERVESVVLAPVGFVSDHMEVVQDLDTEAAATAAEVGIHLERAATVRATLEHVRNLVDLALGPAQWCPAHCCPNPRDPHRAAACQRLDPDLPS